MTLWFCNCQWYSRRKDEMDGCSLIKQADGGQDSKRLSRKAGEGWVDGKRKK